MVIGLRGPHHCLYLRASVWAYRRLCSSEGAGKQPPRGKELTTSTSSLRVDAVAAAGLDIARKKIWEAFLDNEVLLNGERVKKKSTSVKEGDIIEVDTMLKSGDDSREGSLVKRGRVVVKEIGPQTKKGGYHLTLVRYKQYALFRRNFSSWTSISEHYSGCYKFW